MTYLFGMNLTALNTWDDMRGLDYLGSRPEVDADRLGCIGLSLGGTRSMYLSAVDERVKASSVVCYLTTFKQYALTQGNFCGSQFVPGILKYAEVADICGLVAPRPLLIESGIQDGGFPIETAREAYAHLETITRRRRYRKASGSTNSTAGTGSAAPKLLTSLTRICETKPLGEVAELFAGHEATLATEPKHASQQEFSACSLAAY